MTLLFVLPGPAGAEHLAQDLSVKGQLSPLTYSLALVYRGVVRKQGGV